MIHVDGLDFTFPAAQAPTLRDLRFDVAPQEIFGFLGPSGAGKSTTQRILIGLLSGYAGRVQVMGKEVRDWDQDFYQHIGVSFELPNHYQRLTALENLRHFAALYADSTMDPVEALELVGLASDADKRVGQFSKGMKIRLNVARSLLHRPRLLFLDEPTGGLDPVNAHRVKELIQSVRDRGTTVFLTTHDMTVADQLCDRVAFICDGRIDVIEAPDALKKEHGRRVVRVEFTNGAGDLASAEFPLDGLGENAGFHALLQEHRVESMHTQETTLENVFIQLTGRELT